MSTSASATDPGLYTGMLPLSEAARAALDHAASMARTLGPAGRALNSALRAAGLSDDVLADDLDERSRQIESVAREIPAFHAAQAVREWYAEHHGRIAIAAFDEAREQLIPVLEAERHGVAELDPNPGQSLPEYWSKHWIHRTEGGWDGHPYMGFIQGALIHRELVARIMAPADIHQQRREVAQRVAQLNGSRILEMGAGYGPFTVALGEACPQAQLYACEISLRQIEQAQRTLNRYRIRARLIRCAAEQTGLHAGSFDVVTSYALLHELPAAAAEDVFREAFRLLAPGGRLLFVDVPPFEQLDKLRQWQVDFAAKHEGEPYWREAASMDVAGTLRRIGFDEVSRHSPVAGPYPFPFYTEARKP